MNAPVRQSSVEQTILANGRIVLPDRIVEGHVAIAGEAIADIAAGAPPVGSTLDLDGDYLVPGLVELHTDNVEKHLVPRPGVVWPSGLAALLAHDTQLVGAGITTVFDALAVGEYRSGGIRREILSAATRAIAQARHKRLFRAEHYLHLRCEIVDAAMADLLRGFADEPLVRLVSVMDHTPGQRQMNDPKTISRWLTLIGVAEKDHERELEVFRQRQQTLAGPNRAAVLAFARQRRIAVASHDDETQAHIDQSAGEGIALAEFPTTLAAAQAAHDRGMTVIMGAPNLVRGGSHSGNISAEQVASAGLLDVLSSDYAPKSLLHAAFLLWERGVMTLPEAIATITANPAHAVGMDDRGMLVPGKRADLAWVHISGGVPVVRGVWRAGQRVI